MHSESLTSPARVDLDPMVSIENNQSRLRSLQLLLSGTTNSILSQQTPGNHCGCCCRVLTLMSTSLICWWRTDICKIARRRSDHHLPQLQLEAAQWLPRKILRLVACQVSTKFRTLSQNIGFNTRALACNN